MRKAEYKYAAVDIFTCGDTLKPEVAALFLAKAFHSKNPSIHEVKRGIIGITNDKKPLMPCGEMSLAKFDDLVVDIDHHGLFYRLMPEDFAKGGAFAPPR